MPPGIMVTWRGSVMAAKSSCSVELSRMVNEVSRDAWVMLDTAISPLVPFSLIVFLTMLMAGSSRITFRMLDVRL